MTSSEQLARFVTSRGVGDLSDESRAHLKVRVLDSIGCALGALHHPLMGAVRDHVSGLDAEGECSLIGGGSAAVDRAAFMNTALVRYLDFNDSYVGKWDTCHGSDNIGSLLAVAEHVDAPGEDFLVALAIAYQVQCRLVEEAPLRQRGFDHTAFGAYSIAAGCSKLLGVDDDTVANALGISGAAYQGLRVTRTGALSEYKGLAFANLALGAVHACLLAARGVTGPREVFEGPGGFQDSVSGTFELDWGSEELTAVDRSLVKRFNAGTHSQAAIEGVLELQAEHGFEAQSVDRVEIELYEAGFHILGGGDEGDKLTVRTKEDADHSLPYMVAVSLIDGQLLPEQYEQDRIAAQDVQSLLTRVSAQPAHDLTDRFPHELPCRVRITLADGTVVAKEKADFEGFATNPLTWDRALPKYDLLAARIAPEVRGEIAASIERFEDVQVREFTQLLRSVEVPAA